MKTRGRIIAFLLLIVVFAASISTTAQSVVSNIKLGLDLQGGFEVLYQVKPLENEKDQKITEEVLADTAEALLNRINVLGVSEPVIQVEGEDRIRVQLAGVEDQESARELLSTQANLTFRDVEDNLMLDGSDLKEGGAKATFDDKNRPMVTLELKDPTKFAEVTQEISQKPVGQNLLVIWLDFEEGKDSFAKEMSKENPKFVSSPTVSERINSNNVQISGSFTVEETKSLAGVLNAGALPVKLVEKYSTSVGAQFGEKALTSTIFAGVVGTILVALFMLLYYRLPGLVAVITLAVFVYLNLLVFELINGVLTLPGIAAIILGIGIAVDANIITAERIKEEIRIGRSINAAFKNGAKDSFSAIFDSHITSLLASAVLFYFGTSSVKGFAITLIISILVSFITAVWGSRILLGLLVNSGFFDGKPWLFGVKKSTIHHADENYSALDLPTKFDRFDFVKSRKKFFTASLAFLAIGMILLGIFRLNLGIDFSSGTRVEILSEDSLTKEELITYLESIDHPSEDIVISGDKKEIGVIRYNEDFSQKEINKLKATISDEYGAEPNISTVSPTVGKELAKNAVKALIFASIGIIIYTAFRFEWKMGISAILTLLYDAFFMVAVFSIFRLEVDVTFIAAILTIVGYSINDTIVTFDRIRENMKRSKKIETEEELATIVNKSLRQTLGRSVNTVLTVVMVVVALLLFGAESIRNFSLALLIGLISGTYSSIFIAAQLWFVFKKRELKKRGTIDVEEDENKKKWGSDEPVV
ncbi:protein-export membrane protein SecD [Paenisporosarcina sp. HGH0030]|uniref:protein translocase subunit SecDF n=1 Tax=Paenisporosarcina sp. HGH0030 TaxID=1078085 RepID=UPI00034E74A5|nr:protein translocase subunit SecDF [Paenisporosarcina sp. HGH0030]EPD54316.1 protein-export membrane protein SecD [Paenisporosarcina sp. HGH0030]